MTYAAAKANKTVTETRGILFTVPLGDRTCKRVARSPDEPIDIRGRPRISLRSCGLLSSSRSALAHFAEQIVVVIVFRDLRIEQHFLHIRVVAFLGLLEQRALLGDLV